MLEKNAHAAAVGQAPVSASSVLWVGGGVDFCVNVGLSVSSFCSIGFCLMHFAALV